MKKPFNLQEWLSDKSQKVVWSDGTPADIENIELHFLLDTDDLFLVTEDELTEFEAILLSYLSNDTSGELDKETMHKCVKARAEELLAIARKQLKQEGWEYTDPLFKKICEEKLEKTKKEMEESEDERIRKVIVKHFEELHENSFINLEIPDILAWLEKQKDKNCLACDQHLKGYIAGRKVTEEEKQKEQKSAEWSEEDEHRRTDAIYFLESAKTHYADTSELEATITWLKSIRPQPKVEWSEEDKKRLESVIHRTEIICGGNAYGEIKEDIAWLKSLRPQPKQELRYWDKEIISSIIMLLEKDNHYEVVDEKPKKVFVHEREINWLRNIQDYLYPCLSWKPSEEQMDSLRDTIIATKGYQYSQYLPELYIDLEKLI